MVVAVVVWFAKNAVVYQLIVVVASLARPFVVAQLAVWRCRLRSVFEAA